MKWCPSPLSAAPALALILTGCTAGAPRTTRMTADDFDAMIAAMAASFIQSDAVASRTPDSPPWIITIDKVQNLTSDVMTDAEQWAIMARLRNSAPIRALWDQKNIRFVIPAQRVARLRRRHGPTAFDESFGSQRRPTHEMSATFRCVTRAIARQRTELYFCEFEIIDLATAEPVWADRFEYKRVARGHVWD